jgi:divalent metal cation (Fe/Co/Zn/Cd) transporter
VLDARVNAFGAILLARTGLDLIWTASNTNFARRTLVRQAILLELSIIAYNLAEGAIALVAGVLAGSVVLIGFGLDSAIEVSAALVVVWHLTRSGEEKQPHWEQRVAQFVGLTLLLLAVYVLARAILSLATSSEPEESYVGIGLTCASVAVMPLVSRLQYRYALKIDSLALAADSRETMVCTYLSVVTLIGLAANAVAGWWWADPVAALVLVWLIAREGWEVFSRKELVCVD